MDAKSNNAMTGRKTLRIGLWRRKRRAAMRRLFTHNYFGYCAIPVPLPILVKEGTGIPSASCPLLWK
jgi:hypothetical protein